LEYACFRPKAHAHCLSMNDVGGNNLREIHDSPPKAKSATSRSPARSTLA
jgi:hypothetical protein